MTNDLEEIWADAMMIAIHAHTGQVDKNGEPYIRHPVRVSCALDHSDFELMAIGVLHDVLEDSDYTPEDLAHAGMTNRVVDAVVALTHIQGEPRDAYYQRVKANNDALVVKLADIADNSDPVRLAKLDTSTSERLIKKYAKARQLLFES